MRRLVSGIMLFLLMVSTLTLAFNIRPVKAEGGTIYIRADGSIDPSGTAISTFDNVTYTLTGNINGMSVDGIVVERDNIVVDGAGYTVEGTEAYDSKGIFLNGRSNVTIKNMEIRKFAYGFYLNSSNNNNIHENIINANSWYGIWLSTSSNNSIVGNNVTNDYLYAVGIRLFEESYYNYIQGNSLTASSARANGMSYGIYLGDSYFNIVYENVFVNTGLYDYHPYPNVVIDNSVNGKPLVLLKGVSDYAIEDAGQVILVDCENITVENLNLSNTAWGLRLYNTSNSYIARNTADMAGIALLYNSNNNSILENKANSASIFLEYCSNNSVVGNDVSNTSFGLDLVGTWYNNIRENNVENNTFGIAFYFGSNNNSIYHNNFLNNHYQAYDYAWDHEGSEPSINVWDNGYPSGGNYWSNYNGTDLFTGPYQNVTGSDSIGDTPYTIDANNTDRFPLMGPLAITLKTEQARYSWLMFHGDLGHTGFSESPAPTTNQTVWKYITGGAVRSSPAVVDTLVIFGSNDSKVYALDQYSGEQVWSFATGGEVQSSPAVADGKVYVGSFDGKVYCLNATTGGSLWNCSTGGVVLSSPAVAGGRVYVSSWDNKVYCLPQNDPDGSGIIEPGEVLWIYATGGWVTSSPAVVADRVYVGSNDRKIYCLDALTGLAIWNYTTGGLVLSSPAVVDGRVYVGSDDGKVYCLEASSGAFLWSYTTGNRLRSSSAVAGGRVYAGSDDGTLYCLDLLTGASIWNHTTSNWMQSSPAIADGKVYVGSFEGTIDCLNASTGQALWSYVTGIEEWSSPAVADGIIYVGSGNNAVYAFGNVIRVPEDYGTIQEAIDAAAPESTIWIAPGIYNESLVINKTLTIIGKKGSEPIFAGGGTGVAITLLSGASGSIIAGVVITYWDNGILIQGASDCKIYDNTISSITYSGIVLEGANAAHNLVYYNIFERNAVAINLTSSSNDSNIFQNILSQSGTGICLESDGNCVYANTMSSNAIGINMTNSNDNEFYHNNFEGNSVQLHISTSTGNIWDNGYPSGGNYWSDHSAIDVYSGLYQNETGKDGIVDAPYVVAGDNVDNYPLSEPFSLHNIGITSLVGSKTVVGKGYTLRISVKIQNLGMYDESFALTVFTNETILFREAAGVTMRKSVAFDLSLNTSRLAIGNHTLSVVIDNLLGETEISDNSFNCSATVTVPGDIKCDFTVDIYDAILLSTAFNSQLNSPTWNSNADINSDNIVDIFDAIILSSHFSQHYP